MKAYCLIRDQPWYRRSAFANGLRACGYDVATRAPDRTAPGDVLVIWNRYAGNHELASRVEHEGATVLVAENGYIDAGGASPKFQVHPAGPKPEHFYALSRGYHNDSTRLPAGDPARWASFGIELKPWRTGGEYILVCPNRSFGVPSRMMPPDWGEATAKRLRKAQPLPVRIRVHPGNNAPARPLSADLAGAAEVHIWSSSCGAHSLAEGIPTYCAAPYWILKGAMQDRLAAFERLAMGQWRLSEIESGEAFRALLPEHREG